MQWPNFLSTTRGTEHQTTASPSKTNSGAPSKLRSETIVTTRNKPNQPSSPDMLVYQLPAGSHATASDYEDEIAALKLTLSHLEVRHLGAEATIAELRESNRKLVERSANKLSSARRLIKDLQLRNEQLMQVSGREELAQAIKMIRRLRQQIKELQDRLYLREDEETLNLLRTKFRLRGVSSNLNIPPPSLEASQPRATKKLQDQNGEATQTQIPDSTTDQSELIKELDTYIEHLEILTGDFGEQLDDQDETIGELMDLILKQVSFIDGVKKQGGLVNADRATEKGQSRK